MSTRAEHLAWCKERALALVDAGQLDEAFSSLTSDFGKHDETKSSLLIQRDLGASLLINGHLSRPDQMRKWIEGFN